MQVSIKTRESWISPVRGDCSLTTTHFAFAILLGLLLNLNRDEWFVALSFGVLIDADHLFALPRYVSDNGIAAILRPTWDDASGLPWKSSFHHPEGAFIVGYVAIGWRLLVPLVFWGTHVAIDEFQLATLQYSAIIESVFLVGVVSGIFVLGYSRWLELEPEGDVKQYMIHIRERLKSGLSLRPAPQPPSEGTI